MLFLSVFTDCNLHRVAYHLFMIHVFNMHRSGCHMAAAIQHAVPIRSIMRARMPLPIVCTVSHRICFVLMHSVPSIRCIHMQRHSRASVAAAAEAAAAKMIKGDKV